MNPCNVGGDLVLATTSPSALDGLFLLGMAAHGHAGLSSRRGHAEDPSRLTIRK